MNHRDKCKAWDRVLRMRNLSIVNFAGGRVEDLVSDLTGKPVTVLYEDADFCVARIGDSTVKVLANDRGLANPKSLVERMANVIAAGDSLRASKMHRRAQHAESLAFKYAKDFMQRDFALTEMAAKAFACASGGEARRRLRDHYYRLSNGAGPKYAREMWAWSGVKGIEQAAALTLSLGDEGDPSDCYWGDAIRLKSEG